MTGSRSDPARHITVIAAALAIAVSMLIPAGYFMEEHGELEARTASDAAVLSKVVERLVVEHPQAWHYLSHLGELLRRNITDSEGNGISARLLDARGETIAQTAAPLAMPHVAGEAPVFDAGMKVATLRVEAGLQGTLKETALVAVLGLLVGLAIFAVVRTFPLRALRLTLDELRAARDEAREKAAALELQSRESATGAQMVEMLQLATTLEEAGEMIRRCAQVLFADHPGAVYQLDNSRTTLTAVTAWGALAAREAFAPEACWALRRGRLHVSRPGDATPACTHHCGDPDTWICVPMLAQGETLGIVEVGCREGPRVDQCMARAERLASQVSLALGNLKLRESLRIMSIRDSLTGLYNRRYLDETLERELERARRAGTSLAVIMLDADHFKRVNDTYGHEAGDAVLRDLAHILTRAVRGSDIACRYGGEEFCLVLPQMPLEGARNRAEAIRTAAKDLGVVAAGDESASVTISLGVAVFPDDASTPEALLASADAALYQAKRQGRNRVCVFSDTQGLPATEAEET